MITFTVDGPAVPKQRPRLTHGRQAYTPKKTRDYEERVRIAFRSSYHGDVPAFEGGIPVKAIIEVVQAIPKSFSKKKHEAALLGNIVPTAHNGDLDNFAKSILDALNGLVYEDDCQVATLVISKRYGAQPCAIVKFYEESNERTHKAAQVDT